ncbi:DUF1491 family protein [Cohaesibacter celericrescens]|uniref:DUF1491 domain-containing protein n=1 Tax=Cohaesibacter celericrescens TaxID=2067669 RepID=A0A2N5XR40_9HYPH|nr:DUF1491 family protein [Cohaesibacter celericrescens]PLW76973.1 DUF1491 domain-containing protein [Cohaesibacter celericrescens]
MRLTSEIWVSAYLRARNGKNKPSALMRRGAREAGAIYVRVDRLDGTHDLYQPASQFSYTQDNVENGDRLFCISLRGVSTFDIMDKLEAEEKFDADFWVVDTECADGSHDLQVIEE